MGCEWILVAGMRSQVQTQTHLFPDGQIQLLNFSDCQTGLETNARPRLVRFRPGEWYVPPDQPGGRVEFLFCIHWRQ